MPKDPGGAEPLTQLTAELAGKADVTSGTWFGLPCFKVNGKVFAALFGDAMAFKLAGDAHQAALQIPGARLFDPRRQGHPMRSWVQIPAIQSSTWSRFARLACAYVAGAAQTGKDETIAGLVEARSAILAAASDLPLPAYNEVFLGEWCVKDMLAHLVGWDYTNQEAVREILAGVKPSFWAHYDRDWRTYNAMLVARYRRENPAELLASLRESHQALIALLESIPADLYLKKRPMVTLLRAESKDEQTHAGQILAFANQWQAPRQKEAGDGGAN